MSPNSQDLHKYDRQWGMGDQTCYWQTLLFVYTYNKTLKQQIHSWCKRTKWNLDLS